MTTDGTGACEHAFFEDEWDGRAQVIAQEDTQLVVEVGHVPWDGREHGRRVSDVDMVGISGELESEHGRSTVGDVENVTLSGSAVEARARSNKGFEHRILGVGIVPFGRFVEEIGDERTGHGGGRS